MAMTLLPNQVIIEQLKDDFESLFDNDTPTVYNNSTVRTPMPDAKFTEDPLALSVTSYLIWKTNPHRRWTSIDEVGKPTPEARELAHEIRRYYLQRGTMLALMGHQHTEFQFKMLGFLADTRPLKTDELGILYRIPYFYQEDLGLESVFEGATQIEIEREFYNITKHDIITPVREVLKSRKAGDYVQFWFANADGERLTYDVKADNNLIGIFRHLCKQPELKIKCYAKLSVLPGIHIKTRFWRMTGLELQ